MKRFLVVAMVVAGLWFAGFLWAGNHGDLFEFHGQQATVAGWSSVTDHYYLPSCWYDSTELHDTLIDTTHTSWFLLGDGAMGDLIFKYKLAVLDTFGNADSIDTVFLHFEFCADPVKLSTYTYSYTIATGIAAVQTAYTTIALAWADSLYLYPGYNYARCRMIYRCVMDSTYGSWTANCAGKDIFSAHTPVTLTVAYYPLWK